MVGSFQCSTSPPQEMGSKTLESMLVSTKTEQGIEKKPKPQAEEAEPCPRCESTNTKFCYYNNYSLSQPRYFCKSCRRYWTKGGTLRNVPVGGGCRKNKRSSPSTSSNSSSSSASKKGQDQPPPPLITHNPNPPLPLTYDHTSDLTLTFGAHHDHGLSMFGGAHTSNPNSGFLDALMGGFLENPNGYNGNLYQNGDFGHVGSMDVVGEEMSGCFPYENVGKATNVKQENFNWRFPWGSNGEDGGSLGTTTTTADVETGGRDIWNGLGSSSWHGLLNSPLM